MQQCRTGCFAELKGLGPAGAHVWMWGLFLVHRSMQCCCDVADLKLLMEDEQPSRCSGIGLYFLCDAAAMFNSRRWCCCKLAKERHHHMASATLKCTQHQQATLHLRQQQDSIRMQHQPSGKTASARQKATASNSTTSDNQLLSKIPGSWTSAPIPQLTATQQNGTNIFSKGINGQQKTTTTCSAKLHAKQP
ncbi:hypothetical protein Nepgr_011605 [Nepenthes gracilis]|uniref:Uncharacterized protein n=1 Tax=Nepenthes gracilis TaxID=150966 RepID=A0AAD3XMG3_NEPGR|nr:hypothetical protein Nepgr_011605 [Nepenthes gracilis]